MIAGASRWLDEHEADAAALMAMEGEKSKLLELAEQLGHVGHWRIALPEYSVTWSAEVYRIHGVTPDCYTPELEAAIGFYHPDDRETVSTAIATAARDGTPFEFSLRLIRADGGLRHVKSRGLTIAGADGAAAAIFGVFLDVTELQEVNLKLERLVYVDALTQIANRRQFDEILERESLAVYERAGATRRCAELDRIARLAATLTSSPIGLVSLVGQDEQHFAGNFGLEGVDSTGRDVSFCAHTILADDPFVVPDTTRDSRFKENALVTGDLALRYYAGAPIVSETTGYRLGAVCIIGKVARGETTAAQRALLTDLAKMAATILEEKLASRI